MTRWSVSLAVVACVLSGAGVGCGEAESAGTVEADAVGDAEPGADASVDSMVDSMVDAVDDAGPTFEPFPFLSEPADQAVERLCEESAAPDEAADTTFITCALEGEAFAPDGVEPPESGALVVITYNLERGFSIDGQIAWLKSLEPPPDVLLISEADRGCARTDHRHVTREMAQALGMSYIFATEFVELGREGDPEVTTDQCEHGNAVLARYPLGNAREIRHAVQDDWYCPPGVACSEPRLGGRVAVRADMQVGDRVVRLYSLHLESRINGAVPEDIVSAQQAAEIAEEGLASPHPVIAAGDLNAPQFWWDLQQGTSDDVVVGAFLDRGYADSHEGLSYEERITLPPGLVIDLILGRGVVFSAPSICDTCSDLSDHLPVSALVTLQ